MNNDEIISRLNEADLLLSRYKELIAPALAELANRKMKAVGVSYRGEFGCWEEGIDTLCMHIEDRKALAWSNESYSKAYDWENETREKLFSNLKNISLSGFF